MDKKQITILIVAGILLLILGFCMGILFQANNKVQVIKNQAVNNLSSKTVSSITAYGKVTDISGRDITLNNLGENLIVSMSDTARIYSFAVPVGKKNTTPTQQTISFGDIKIGDNVNIVLKLSANGQMQSQSLVILPKN